MCTHNMKRNNCSVQIFLHAHWAYSDSWVIENCHHLKNKVWSFCKSAEKFCLKNKGNFFPPENVVLLNFSLHLQLPEPLPKPGLDFFLTRWSLFSPRGWRYRRQWDSPPSESLTWSLKLTPYRCSDPKRHLTALSFFWKSEEYHYVSESCFKNF